EEVCSHIPHVEEESVHLTRMPERVAVDAEFMEKWNTFIKFRDEVKRALEVARNEEVVGKSLEAKVLIGSNNNFDATTFLQQFSDLQQLIITSQAEVVDKVENGESYQYGDIYIEHAHGEKCERCWNYSESLGSVDELDNLCPRCQAVLKTLV